jgi:hypothetical protein
VERGALTVPHISPCWTRDSYAEEKKIW